METFYYISNKKQVSLGRNVSLVSLQYYIIFPHVILKFNIFSVISQF